MLDYVVILIFRRDGSKRMTKDQREQSKKLSDASKRIDTLENLLERAERDAKVKSEQVHYTFFYVKYPNLIVFNL